MENKYGFYQAGIIIFVASILLSGILLSKFNGFAKLNDLIAWNGPVPNNPQDEVGNDQVADTPTQQTSNFGCPSFPKVTCSNGPNGDMFMNYMDYTDDLCMYMFSGGQKIRSRAIFAVGGARASFNL